MEKTTGARPSCPKHPGSKVLLDGCYGASGHRKQRYKCVQPDGSRHVFTEKLPRLRYASDQACDECERQVPHTHGPQHPRNFHFQARQIARALVQVGQGASYRKAAQQIRVEAKRGVSIWGTWNVTPVQWGGMVADWVEIFAPVIYEEIGPKAFTNTIVIDSLPFKKSARRTTGLNKGKLIPGGVPLFSILGIVGYDENRKPFILRLEAFPTDATWAWMHIFTRLEGKPSRIVCDQANRITLAIRLRWDKSGETPDITFCHWHLGENLKRLIPKKRQHDGDPLWDTFKKALWGPNEFEDFIVEARKEPKMHRWITRWRYKVGQQLERKLHPNSNGAIEEPFKQLGRQLGDRVFTFTNRERLNRLLMLHVLEANGVRNEVTYARIIRQHLEANDGFAPLRHQILDPKGSKSSLRF